MKTNVLLFLAPAFSRSFFAVLVTLALQIVRLHGAESVNLYGIHDHSPDPSEYLNHIKPVTGNGFITATVTVGANPNDFSGTDFSFFANQGYTVICRINYDYFPNGTIPVISQYDNFATRCKNFVAASPGCSMWIIGNELNLSSEWPLNGSRYSYVAPTDYASCYRKVYNAIRSIRPSDKILPAPTSPFAGPYGAGSQNGYPTDAQPLNWVQYENQMLAACKSSGAVDGIPLHINSRGYAYADIHSTAQVNAGGQNLYWSFFVYKDWVNYGIPTNMWNLPLYATECNGYYYWKGGHPEDPTKHYEAGWMQEIYNEINSYNQTAYLSGKPLFHCINMYRWCATCDGWSIDGADNPYKGQILSDLDAAVAQKYTWKANDAKAISISAPGSVTAGSTFAASVTMHNRGTGKWTNTGNPHRLGSQSPQDNTTWGFNRVDLPTSPINPNSDVTFNFSPRAPSTPGTYTFAWKMVQDGVEWFGDTISTTITVTGASVIVDNSDAGFSASANWATGTSSTDKYGSNYRFRSVVASSDAATWTGTLAAAGNYNVYAWWPQGSNRSTASPYIVYYNGGSTTVKMNQQINGGTWNYLAGPLSMNAGTNSVKLSCWTTDTNHVVLGDAIKWLQQ